MPAEREVESVAAQQARKKRLTAHLELDRSETRSSFTERESETLVLGNGEELVQDILDFCFEGGAGGVGLGGKKLIQRCVGSIFKPTAV